jgi:Holliday junction resolvase RusA-like endonuclease
MKAITFTVYGKVQSQGSTKAFIPKGWSRPIITSTNKKLKPWRQQISASAIEAVAANGGEIMCRPNAVRVAACFYIEKPVSCPKSRRLPAVAPDLDKYTRGLLDACTGTVYEDDAQVTDIVVAKRYGVPERAEIQVEIIEDATYKPDIAKELPLFAGAFT